MTEIFLMTTFACAVPELINKTKAWTEADQTVYEIAIKKCSEIYKGEAPCLKIFVKVDTHTYRVTCGK